MNQMNKINYFSCVMVIVIILSALTQAHGNEFLFESLSVHLINK